MFYTIGGALTSSGGSGVLKHIIGSADGGLGLVSFYTMEGAFISSGGIGVL